MRTASRKSVPHRFGSRRASTPPASPLKAARRAHAGSALHWSISAKAEVAPPRSWNLADGGGPTWWAKSRMKKNKITKRNEKQMWATTHHEDAAQCAQKLVVGV